MEPLGLRSQDFFSTLWEDYMTLLPPRPVPIVFDEYIRFGSALPTREVPQLALGRPTLTAMRDRDGRDVVCEVLVVKDKGRHALEIHHRLAGGSPENHVVPLLREIVFQDIVIGVYPQLMSTIEWEINAPNEGGTSLGDAMNILAQTLEGLAYMHERRVAHRDMFLGNIMLTWHPCSFKTQQVPARRPTVYIIDLGCAVYFPEHTPLDSCLSPSCPIVDYGRPQPPDINWASYNPFHLDMWQLGHEFGRIKAPDAMKELQSFLSTLGDQTSAQDAHDMLCRILGRIPPAELLVVVEKDPPDVMDLRMIPFESEIV